MHELREVRNRWAHQHTFSTDDPYRALDSAARLLTAVSAPQADDIEKGSTYPSASSSRTSRGISICRASPNPWCS